MGGHARTSVVEFCGRTTLVSDWSSTNKGGVPGPVWPVGPVQQGPVGPVGPEGPVGPLRSRGSSQLCRFGWEPLVLISAMNRLYITKADRPRNRPPSVTILCVIPPLETLFRDSRMFRSKDAFRAAGFDVKQNSDHMKIAKA